MKTTLTLLALISFVGCSSTSDEGSNLAAAPGSAGGGVSNPGGNSSVGGALDSGDTSAGAGGSLSTGGALGPGGSPSVGGAAAGASGGGAANMGGVQNSGGEANVGGAGGAGNMGGDPNVPNPDWDGDIPQYITYLTAGAADRSAGLTVRNCCVGKYYWVTDFDNSSDFLTWTMNEDAEEVYHVWALLETEESVPITLSVEGTPQSIEMSTEDIGWQKLDMGTITIPAGQSRLTFVRNNNSPNMMIKSLELIKESDLPAYRQRVEAYKGNMTWLREANYGIFFQYGAWGYPKSGDRKSINQGAADFDVPAFADMIESTGARYIVWSLTWHQYWLQTPNEAVDNILGHSNFTSERDLVGEIAQAMHDRGIRFMLYYHQGLQTEPDWKDEQNFPGGFRATGVGDRSVFLNNWKAVISELGNRFGTNLDGWVFDDGTVYYPTNFEDLARAARAGNPNRFITYNEVNAVSVTDFQDMTLGEQELSEASHHGAPQVGGDGLYTEGPRAGLFQHSMKPVDYWGIFEANQSVSTGMSANAAVSAIRSAAERGVAISFGLAMWEDGSVLPSSLEVLRAVGEELQ